MAEDTFYNFYKKIRSKASNHDRASDGTLNLPGKAYLQGVSVRDIHTERGALPVIGRDGYKTIAVERIVGGAKNRTIINSEDRRKSIAFVETDRLQPARFTIVRTDDFVLSIDTYNQYIKGIVFPNGEKLSFSDIDDDVERSFINHVINLKISVDQKIPLSLVFRSIFRGYRFVYFDFITDSINSTSYKVTLPDGGIQQVQNFAVLSTVIGHDKDYDENTPYTDLQKFDPIVFINENAPPGMYPDVTPSASYAKARDQLFNGIIEPFKIRTDVYDLDIYAKTDPVRPNKLTGQVMDEVDFFANLKETLNSGSSPFEDMGGSIKNSDNLLESSYVSAEKFMNDPFIERDSTGDTLDQEIKALLESNIGDTGGILPFGAVAQRHGFEGIGNDKVNSILYRGRLR